LYAGNYSTFLLRKKQTHDEQTARYKKAENEKRKLTSMLKATKDVSHKADNSRFDKKASGRFKGVFNTYKMRRKQMSAGRLVL
jgi:ATPase subunit of ABC transporter with duplicated ATPase domains